MATLTRTRPRAQHLCQCHRAFSTSTPRAISLQLDKNDPDSVADTVPPYPYGPTRWYKQSSLGLYGGQRIQFGNNVGEKIEVKTRRKWHLTVLTRKLFSKALNRAVQVRVTTRTLRTIDKLGGLDEYLLGEKEGRIKALGESGWWLRWAVMQTPSVKARFAAERERLGVPDEIVEQEEVEVAEAQNVIEDASGVDEAEAAAEIGEAVGTDGAFQVEQPAGLPPLKFRVGPGKHLILTSQGWIRTRPDPERLANIAKSRILRILEEQHLPEWEATFISQLAHHNEQEDLRVGERLNAEDRVRMLKEAKKQWRKDLEVKAAEEYEAKIALREEKKGVRRARKREVKAEEREKRAVPQEV